MSTRGSTAASTALLTDHYELTMLQAALASGEAHRRCVFEAFRFGDDELRFLSDSGVADRPTVDWLAAYRFSGDISGYAEGECYFPGSPPKR